jgi:hypothetical protein
MLARREDGCSCGQAGLQSKSATLGGPADLPWSDVEAVALRNAKFISGAVLWRNRPLSDAKMDEAWHTVDILDAALHCIGAHIEHI